MRRVCLLARKTLSIANQRLPPPSLISWQIVWRKRPRICWTITIAIMSTGIVRTLEIVRSVGGRRLHTPWCAVSAGCRSVAAACGTDFELGLLHHIRSSGKSLDRRTLLCLDTNAFARTIVGDWRRLEVEGCRLRAWSPSFAVRDGKSIRLGVTRAALLSCCRAYASCTLWAAR